MKKTTSIILQNNLNVDLQSGWMGYPVLPQNICLIPMEVDKDHDIVGILLLDQEKFPGVGQINPLDVHGFISQRGPAGLSVRHGPLDETLQHSYITTLLKLAMSIDGCDIHTSCHTIRTAIWAKRLAVYIGYSEEDVEIIFLAGKLHDIGKVVVPKEVLTKPSPLNDKEWEIMRRHPSFGAVLLEPSEQLRHLAPIVEAHHENYNGTGYPHGLAGKDIIEGARLLSIADAYTTMTDGRAYRKALSTEEAIQELRHCTGTQFDPVFVGAMIDLIQVSKFEDCIEDH